MDQIQFYAREVSIMQQSQSKLALEFLTSHGISPTSQEIWQVTEVFVQCCLHAQNDVLKKRLKDLDKWVEKRKLKK
jgi:hypothetical protein